MSTKRNLNDGNIPDILRRLYKLERQAALSHSAIGREGLEVYDGGWIRIINGGLQVIGTATISGTLDVTGTFNASGDNNMSGTNNLSGDNNLTGPTDVTGDLTIQGMTTISGNTSITGELVVTGPTKLDGITEIGGDTSITGQLDVTGPMATKGTLSVEGVTTLKNDLNIEAGGKINAGNLQIEPANGGQINFANGSLADGQFGLAISNTVGVQIATQSLKVSLPSKGSVTANVYIDDNNQLWKVV